MKGRFGRTHDNARGRSAVAEQALIGTCDALLRREGGRRCEVMPFPGEGRDDVSTCGGRTQRVMQTHKLSLRMGHGIAAVRADCLTGLFP